MTHANTFKPFKSDLAKFPCFDLNNCGVVDGPCPYNGDLKQCTKGKRLDESVIKICDSGVFQRKGCEIPSYKQLFQEYEDMGADFGIIMDVLKDKDKTLATAKEAIELYKQKKWAFDLIGVAQGNKTKEYIECYTALQDMGYEHIAIGGMLKRREKSARYVSVRDESLLIDILSAIRKIDKDGWIFALGCYAPGRHRIFLEHHVSGADYKGWIFQYEGRSSKRGNKKSQKKRFKAVRNFIEDKVLIWSQKHREGPRLLIVPCAKTKVKTMEKIQAYRLYNGPVYNMLRKYQINFSNNDGLDIFILSAKYGLIEPTKRISYYDQKMNPSRVDDLQADCNKKLAEIISKKPYSDIIVNLGKDYYPALSLTLDAIESGTDPQLHKIEGTQGERLHQVKEWILS